jgi:hypothetical protein
LGRVINTEYIGKQRKQITRSIVLAIRELMIQTGITDEVKDLSAYIVIGLETIADSIDATVEPWEKRGYWLKADKFRLQWEWTRKISQNMSVAILSDNWADVAINVANLTEKLNDIDLPKRHNLGTPWKGAYKEFHKRNLK